MTFLNVIWVVFMLGCPKQKSMQALCLFKSSLKDFQTLKKAPSPLLHLPKYLPPPSLVNYLFNGLLGLHEISSTFLHENTNLSNWKPVYYFALQNTIDYRGKISRIKFS